MAAHRGATHTGGASVVRPMPHAARHPPRNAKATARRLWRIRGDYVEKPLLSPEGANVVIHKDGGTIAADGE